MASPVSVPASGIKAVYYGGFGLGFLELSAKGEVPSVTLTPFFKREPLAGGLLFSLVAFSGGVFPPGTQPPPLKPFDVTNQFKINLPQPHFNNASVLVETQSGTYTIPIKYISGGPGPVKPPGGDSNDSSVDNLAITGDVLPPIARPLLAESDLVISATIPKITGFNRAYVRPSFSAEFFKLVNSEIDNEVISWTFTWNKLPTGEHENPQLINITTTLLPSQLGPGIAKQSRIVQGYVVTLVQL